MMTTAESRATRPSRRDVQAAATRDDIVEAATRLMLDGGYILTSISAIAREANVAVQTIYNSIGNKAELLSVVLDRLAVGPEAPALEPDVLRFRVAQARTRSQVITVMTDWFVEVNQRTARINQVINQAASVDRDIAEWDERRSARRLHNYGEAASSLRVLHGLRSGLSDPEAAAALWSIGHPQIYRSLVVDIGWSADAYRQWVKTSLTALLA